jgi:hypothetical protein
MGETGEGEVRVGVICENGLGSHVFTDIACSNAVGKLAFKALNRGWKCIGKGGKTLCQNNSIEQENSLE